MKYYAFLISAAILFCSAVYAQSPPFSTITIYGKAKSPFTKVSLFESGSSRTPIKSENISSWDGSYSITIDIRNDMRGKGNYYYTDMRFWDDKNGNGTKDPGEPISQCHFIIWVPTANKIYLQVYEGPQYEITSSSFNYDYK
jgi:hypothetical protein